MSGKIGATPHELPPNPVKILSTTGQWNRVEPKQTIIAQKDLPAVFKAIRELNNPTVRDYLTMLLLTGARRTEMSCLSWDRVDMKGRVFTLAITKTGKPLCLPMSDYVFKVFKEREALRENEFVFPGVGKTKHLVESRRSITFVEQATNGVTFTPHDLRRTFASYISGTVAGAYELKRLLNHAKSRDITESYVVQDLDKLRKIVQESTDYILKLCRQKKAKGKARKP